MLVTYVLRNIVLPHLRNTPGATAVAAGAVASSSRATIATSSRQARAAEALVAEREDVRWEPFRLRPHDVPKVHLMPRDVGPARAARREDMKRCLQATCSTSEVSRSIGRKQRTSQSPPNQITKAGAQNTQAELPLLDSTPCARHDVPPSIAKLLHAKLYRLAVFQVLDTPEYLSDPALISYILHVLEKNGAGKLARRLRTSLEFPNRTPEGKLRLQSEPASKHPRPPDFWRMPLVPRPLDGFPEATRQERLTHAHNLTISRLLTVTHPIPYEAPFHTRRAPLRRLRDVLHHVEDLRRNRGFVPDRVTANIVVKAWLNCLARASSRGERGLSRNDLRDIFQLVADSFETKSNPLDRAGEAEQAMAKGGKVRTTASGSKATSAFPRAEDNGTEAISALVFDPRVDYDRHVEPFAKMMTRAMFRVGDHAGRKRVEAWAAGMAKKLGVEEGETQSRRIKKSTEHHI